MRKPVLGSQVVRPVRKDSLPAPPPKDTIPASISSPIPSNMTAKVMDAPLPALPSLTRVNSPPNAIPRRKPVGSGASMKSPPLRSGEISPADSFSSLLSAYGTEDSGARYSVETAATKYSSMESSPPKLPPKDSLSTNTSTKLGTMSPLSLQTPASSKMDRPPTPPAKDDANSQSPEMSFHTPISSPTAASSQSPPKPQIWRRRSLKSDKPLAVPEKLKLAVSHGSTDSPHQVTTSVKTANHLLDDTPAEDSPTLKAFGGGLPGRNVRPSPSFAPPGTLGNDKSRDSMDGFTQYAQDLGLDIGSKTAQSQYSPAKISPDDRRPPTPEYAKDEAKSNGAAIYSPVSPMTPPQDKGEAAQGEAMKPLNSTHEDPVSAPPSAPLPGLPGRSSSNSGSESTPAPRKLGGLPGNPRPAGQSPKPPSTPASNAATVKETSTLSPSPMAVPAAMAPSHERSSSATSVPTISVSDDGDTSTIKASSPQPTAAIPLKITTTSANPPVQKHQQQPTPQQPQAIWNTAPTSPTSPTDPRPGNPAYFPMRHYLAKPVAPGTVLAAPAIKPTQLACFGGHYRFVPARNEAHPLACATCCVKDNAMRLTCAHCALRVCKDCCDVLMMNGRDVSNLIAMLKG